MCGFLVGHAMLVYNVFALHNLNKSAAVHRNAQRNTATEPSCPVPVQIVQAVLAASFASQPAIHAV